MRPLAHTPLTELNVTFGLRPDAPRLAEATDAHRRQGRILGQIHQHYLGDLARIAQLLSEIDSGSDVPETLAQAVKDAELTKNMRSFGTLCGQQCNLLLMHHDAEEAMMFPQIAAQDNPGLQAVVARLRAEHMVVHELICRLIDATEALSRQQDPKTFALTVQIFRRLAEVVASHFKYEEEQLTEALGLFVKSF